MKFYETHYEEYIQTNKNNNLHPKLDKIYDKFPKNIHDLKNLIFYGPSGVGKYTQLLKVLKKYSPTELKYEKKISVTYNKQQYLLKISDIHYEIDMSLLGCYSKILWHEFYQQIVDIVSTKPDKCGIIVCKYFHEIHSELLENFYSYMQNNHYLNVDLKYFILTEQISFIPDNIYNCCERINIPRPSKLSYTKCMKIPKQLNIEDIKNMKTILSIKNNTIQTNKEELGKDYINICNKIIDKLINIDELKLIKFRDMIYDIFIYNLDITECIWYIVNNLLKQNKIQQTDIGPILIKTYQFFQFYNNNYRPIYHLESYFLFLVKIIHGY